MIGLSVGTFWFPSKSDFSDINDNILVAHAVRIETALKSIDNISDLIVRVETKHHSGNGKFSSGYISFVIFIPMRIQKDMPLIDTDCTSEHFQVLIKFNYHEPVAYIFYECDSHEMESPTDGLIAVREFLEDKLSKNLDVGFETIGPTPFHASFFS